MSLGGRPKEEGGHKGIHISLNAETYKGLEKIHDKDGNRSKFVEHAIHPHIRQLDPGESCRVLGLIDGILNCEIVSAISNQDFEKVATLATIGNSLTPFRGLCEILGRDDATESGEHYLECVKPQEDGLCEGIMSFLKQRKKASGL